MHTLKIIVITIIVTLYVLMALAFLIAEGVDQYDQKANSFTIVVVSLMKALFWPITIILNR